MAPMRLSHLPMFPGRIQITTTSSRSSGLALSLAVTQAPLACIAQMIL